VFSFIRSSCFGGGNGLMQKKCNLAIAMQSLSVVIVCRNEADVIAETLLSLQGLTDDIIVFDNGSTDNTINRANQFNVKLQQGTWEGFGKTKMKAIAFAKYDWILSLDADEAIDEELKRSLLSLPLNNENEVYELQFKNFMGNKYLKHGEWGGDKHIRLFNRKIVTWNDAPVHERLITPADIIIKKLNGYVLHRTVKSIKAYKEKMEYYAALNAEKYYSQGKSSSWTKMIFAPAFSFFKNYFLKMGFLDGREGYISAKITAHYTFLKYAKLKELIRQTTISSPQSGQTS
jgi:glycosyltransferase involved in cell wall biosynthesis